ncbi:MAG TPA: DUF2017 domain-containing protein [Mycobacteriales bacterium]|jgi:hypothetical protein|nr:DUF2017 domain-containing protein [Mycobacteriales bacterium]
MASVRRKGDAIRVELKPEEAALLRVLVGEVLRLLDPGPAETGADPLEELTGMSSQPVESPTDPALQRLLPDAYAEDDVAAREFRRLTDSDLRGAKREALQHIVDSLATGQPTRSGASRFVLDQASAAAWLPALTDVRLVVASRLGIEEDIDLERMAVDPDTARFDEIALYDWLSYLQEALVHAVAGD